MNVAPGRQIHNVVGAPTGRPHHLFNFLFDRRRHGRVADVGVDLDEEVAPDDLRLKLGVIDVCWNDRTAACHFIAHELRRHEFRQRCTKTFAVSQRCFRPRQLFRTTAVLAMGDEAHFLRDDTGARELKLRHHLTIEAAHRLRLVREVARQILARRVAIVFGFYVAALVGLDAAALFDPRLAVTRQAFFDVDLEIRFRIRPRCVVEPERRLATASCSSISRSGTRMSGYPSGDE